MKAKKLAPIPMESILNSRCNIRNEMTVGVYDEAIKLSIDGINEINPKLTKFAISIAQKENKNVHSED